MRAVVAGEVAEAPDHAPARDVAEKVIVRQRRRAHQRAVRVHPILDGIGNARQADARDAPRGHGLLRHSHRLRRGKTPDVLVPAKRMRMHWRVSATIHGDALIRRHRIEIELRRIMVSGFQRGAHILRLVRGIGEIEQIKEVFLAKDRALAAQLRTELPRHVEVIGAASEAPSRECVGEFALRRAFGFGERGQHRTAVLQQFIETEQLRKVQIRHAHRSARAVGLLVVGVVVGREDAGLARERELHGGPRAGAEEFLVVGHDGRAEAVERREGLEDAGLVREVVEVFLLRIPQRVIAAATIREEVHHAFERGVERAGAGVVALIAEAVNVARDMRIGLLPITRAHHATKREVPRLACAHLRFRPAQQRREQHRLQSSCIIREHETEARVRDGRQTEAALARLGDEREVARLRGDMRPRQMQISLAHDKVELLVGTRVALLRHRDGVVQCRIGRAGEGDGVERIALRRECEAQRRIAIARRQR